MSHSKKVLITGASSGIGRDCARLFAEAGWDVIAGVRRAAERKDLFAGHPRIHLTELDVTQAPDRARLTAELAGSLDCLVNNAGFGIFASLEDLTEEELRSQMETCFFGAAFVLQACLPALRKSQGRVINVSSILGLMGTPLSGAYCASKFALTGLSESLSYELAPFGVQVCSLEPGGFRTEFAKNSLWGRRVFGQGSPYEPLSRRYKEFREGTVFRSAGDPEQVARKILSLAGCRRMPVHAQIGLDSRFFAAFRKWIPSLLYFGLLRLGFRYKMRLPGALRVK